MFTQFPQDLSALLWADVGGKLSLQTAAMLDTIMIICVRFSLSDGDGIELQTPDRTLRMV